MALSCRTEALRAALAAHDDVEVLRGLCEGGRVPAELRADVWKVRGGGVRV